MTCDALELKTELYCVPLIIKKIEKITLSFSENDIFNHILKMFYFLY